MLIPLKNKKAQTMFDIFIVMVVILVIIIFFAMWKYGFNLLTTTLHDIQTPANSLNISISNISDDTFGLINTGLNGLDMIALAIFFGMVLNIIMSNYLIKVNPAFFIVYWLVLVLAIILSLYVSNSAETMMQMPLLGAAIQENVSGTFILLNLPVIITVVGFIGGIFLMSGLLRDRESGGGFQ